MGSNPIVRRRRKRRRLKTRVVLYNKKRKLRRVAERFKVPVLKTAVSTIRRSRVRIPSRPLIKWPLSNIFGKRPFYFNNRFFFARWGKWQQRKEVYKRPLFRRFLIRNESRFRLPRFTSWVSKFIFPRNKLSGGYAYCSRKYKRWWYRKRRRGWRYKVINVGTKFRRLRRRTRLIFPPKGREKSHFHLGNLSPLRFIFWNPNIGIRLKQFKHRSSTV